MQLDRQLAKSPGHREAVHDAAFDLVSGEVAARLQRKETADRIPQETSQPATSHAHPSVAAVDGC